jgi:peroxiredoxin family protein
MKAIIKNIFSSFFSKKEIEKQEEEISPVKYLSFKEEMQNNIIPRVAQMIVKEKKHLEFLKSQPQTDEVKQFICTAEFQLKHFTQRHQEYVKYADNLQ